MLTEDQIYVVGFMLEDEGLTHSEIDQVFLSHFGVKGMKWGVSRSGGKAAAGRTARGYNARQNRKADRMERRADKRDVRSTDYRAHLDRVATGTKTSGDLLKMYNTTNLWDVGTAVANKESLGKAYKRNREGIADRFDARTDRKRDRAQLKREHAERVVRGKGTAKDALKYYGTLSVRDTVRGAEGKG